MPPVFGELAPCLLLGEVDLSSNRPDGGRTFFFVSNAQPWLGVPE